MSTFTETLPKPAPRPLILRRPKETTGFWSWFTTIDHKKIAIMYGATALMFFVVGGIEALLIRLQLAGPNGTVLTASQYNTMFTMHGTTMVFLVGMPLAVAFGNYFIPLQIGARRRVPAPQHVRLLGRALRRPVHLLRVPPRRRAERWLVRVRAAHEQPALHRRASRPRPRLLGRRHRPPRHRVDDVGHQLHRHGPEHARPA